MFKLNIPTTLVTLAVAAAVSACGGGGGGGGGGGPTVPVVTTDVPASAQQSVSGLITFINGLIVDATSETSEPILIGDAVLPVDDTVEPTPII